MVSRYTSDQSLQLQPTTITIHIIIPPAPTMALTDKQRADLHAGIYDYFLSRGEELAQCAEALADADPEVLLRHNNNNTNTNTATAAGTTTTTGGIDDSDTLKGGIKSSSRASIGGSSSSSVPILEKKWTAVPRLQRRVLELERQLATNAKQLQQHHRNTAGGGTAEGDAADDNSSGGGMLQQLRERRNLPRPPATHTLQGHSAVVTSVALHPIYTLAASGSEDGTIKIWDYETGDYLRTLRGHTNAITSLEFAPKSGYYMVSSSMDLSIKLWDVQEEYVCVRTLRGHDHTISCAKFVPPSVGAVYLEKGEGGAKNNNGAITTTTTSGSKSSSGGSGSSGVDPYLAGAKFIVSASRDQTVKFWDVESGFCDHTLSDHGDWVRCLAVRAAACSTGGGGAASAKRNAAVGGDRKAVGVVEAGSSSSGEGEGENDNNLSSISSLALVASSGNDRTIYVYNAHDKREKVCELRGHDHVVESLSFLCSSLLPRTISTTLSSSKQSSSAAGASASSSISASASSPRDYLASGSRDRTVRLWSIANGGSCLMTFRAHENWVRSVLVHPSGNHILSCGDDRSIRVFDIKSNRCLRTIEDAHSHFVTSLAIHPTLPIMISGGVDHTVKCWQLD
jgi:platelet-activating factor acetylhydrolase IB subunit alpha